MKKIACLKVKVYPKVKIGHEKRGVGWENVL
jgi:hypothetical protein